MPSQRRFFAPDLLHRRLDPDLPGLEARLAAYRQQAFARHIHESASVGLVLSGATRLGLADESLPLAAGDLACIDPGRAHACNPVPGARFGYVMFHLSPEAARLAAGTTGSPVFAAPVVRGAATARDLAALFRIMSRPASRLEKETLFHRALAPLFAEGGDRRPSPATGDLDAVEAYLRAHFRDNVSLADLAALCGQTPTGLLRRFKRQCGLPPHAFQNQLRVDAAKTLLARGLPAALVAQEVGFADQSHLIRTFTPLVGATPGQYRRALDRR